MASKIVREQILNVSQAGDRVSASEPVRASPDECDEPSHVHDACWLPPR